MPYQIHFWAANLEKLANSTISTHLYTIMKDIISKFYGFLFKLTFYNIMLANQLCWGIFSTLGVTNEEIFSSELLSCSRTCEENVVVFLERAWLKFVILLQIRGRCSWKIDIIILDFFHGKQGKKTTSDGSKARHHLLTHRFGMF